MFDTSDILLVLLTVVVAAAIALGATPLVKKLAVRLKVIDVPKDSRRVHKKPIPLMGGLAIIIAFFLTACGLYLLTDRMVMEKPLLGVLIGAAIIVVLGIFDDKYALPALPKFFVQILAAGIVVAFGCRIDVISNPFSSSTLPYWVLPEWLSIILTIVWVVAITNAVNFIDGLDGLAAGISAISACTMLVVALLTGQIQLALIMAALLGGCLGFLPYNFNPAKIFMGDTGSTFLGFLLATLSIQGMFKLYAVVSFVVPILILGVPIFDICFAFLRRIARGQNPMTPDRGHIHHRLIDLGFTQRQAVAVAYMMTAILGLTAVVLTIDGEMQALLMIGAFILAGAVGILMIMRSHFGVPPEQDGNDASHPKDDRDDKQ